MVIADTRISRESMQGVVVDRFRQLFLVAILLASATALASGNNLVLNTVAKAPLNTADKSGFMDRISIELFSRAGFSLRTVRIPAERGLKNVNAGIDDGEMSRIKGLSKVYENIVRVPEKIMDWEFVVFCRKDLKLGQGWEALKDKTVAIINGWKILERKVPARVELTRVRNASQLFTLLKKDRVDLVVYEKWSGLKILADKKMSNYEARYPALEKKEMFIYLNKKHKHLINKLAGILKKMKQDGLYNKIYQQTLGGPGVE